MFYKKILLPFDGLPLPDDAFLPACTVAEAMSAELILLRVAPSPPTPTAAAADSEQLYSELKALQAQVADCAVPVTIATMPGAAEDAVVHYAGRHDVDLIVVIRREARDSVAEKVFHDAPCALLALRPHS